MTCRTLLKSCATPPVSLPTASIFCAWSSCASACGALGDGRRDALLEQLVGLPQDLLGFLAVGDVDDRADVAEKFAVVAEARRGGAQAPSDNVRRARRSAVFDLERLVGRRWPSRTPAA